MSKNKLRRACLFMRDALSEDDVSKFSKTICDKFIENYKDYDRLFIYHAVRKEVLTDRIIEAALKAGKEVFLPKVVGQEMLFGKMECKEDLVHGYMGICEPIEICDIKPDIIVVPCVAADLQRFRIGYGKGYYDRFLSDKEACVKVGLAYDFQIVESIEPKRFDVAMDVIITEKRMF